MEKDLEGLGFVGAGLYSLEQRVQCRIAGEHRYRKRHREYTCQELIEPHMNFDARREPNV
jgi:hypothetical protein